MNKNNGYSFADNEAPKAKSEKSESEASLVEKLVASFGSMVFANFFIWSPMFFVDNLTAQIILAAILAIVSIVVTYFMVQYFKKHWHDHWPECTSHYNSSASFKRSSTPSDYFTLPYGRFNRRR